MNPNYSHPMAEKLQVQFQNQDFNPLDDKDVKKTIFNHRTDLSRLQEDFKMREEGYDLQREFEIQYEQFITNISSRSTKGTHR